MGKWNKVKVVQPGMIKEIKVHDSVLRKIQSHEGDSRLSIDHLDGFVDISINSLKKTRFVYDERCS